MKTIDVFTDPEEVHLVAETIVRRLGIRGGAINPATLAGVARASPKYHRELMEDAEEIVVAINAYRRRRAGVVIQWRPKDK